MSSSATKEKEKSYNSSIPNHFAVMCVMEDLIGSPDAESEDSLIQARARAVGQLSGLANTMGRDWCENEIIPYLMRIALEDEKSVSIAATSQVADLCETKYFSKSVDMQESLVLSVGVAFLTSAHREVREAALVGVRKACVIFARNNNKQQQQQNQEQTENEASQLLLRIVQRLLFDTSYPTSIASGLILLSPSSVQISAALPPFLLRPIPLLTQDSIYLISTLFGADSILTQLRLETAICGGFGRVMVIDNAIVALVANLLESNNNNSSRNLKSSSSSEREQEDVLYSCTILLNYLLEHVFSSSCPSAMFLEESLPKLCTCLETISSSSNSSSLQKYTEKIIKCLTSVFSKIIRGWSSCEDWAARFEIAKYSPQIFDSLLKIYEESSSSSSSVVFPFYELSMELLQRVLPNLANDDEVEVNSAAAGSLPQLVSRSEKSASKNSNNPSSSFFTSSSLCGIFSSENEKFSQQLSVQEAVAASLGETMKKISDYNSARSNNNNNNNNNTGSSTTNLLASTAQSTLSEMLSTCQDDGVRVSIVISLLWSSVVDSAISSEHNHHHQNHSNNPLLLQGEFKQSLRSALDHLTDVPHSTTTENPEIPQTTVTSWRIREQLGEATGKMLAKILLHTNHLHQHFQFPASVVDFIINPFVRLLFDRFYQVRSTSLSQLLITAESNINHNNSRKSSSKVKSEIPSLWDWILQFKPTAQRAPHYQTRVAYISCALICASESEFIQILENSSRDKVANVRRAVAMALTQGSHNNNNNNHKGGTNNNNSIDSNSESKTTAMKDDPEEKNDTILKSQSLSEEEKFYLVPNFYFTWSPGVVTGRVLDLLEKLVSDESSDVREAAIAGLSRCS